ncbi:hypothetical protein GCM10010197_17870 [Nocardioides luteus]|uniref:Ig-like domain-containing protein n=1 Tax=Nocardioides luteus TaxID=1844 RepID=A0ABQ5T4J4_9ACTN|nr:hypothetical protein GCM10010197_17870 [Nocardioides luteus]GLJ70652.1 hypothetical protein GCM10017579_46880 [Nocardioides luteus]
MLLTVIAVGVGVLTLKDDEPEAPEVKGDLSSADTTTMHVRRGAFCDRVPTEDVTEALGGAAAEKKAYGDGDQTAISGEVSDVAQEYGCIWTGPEDSGTTARAWVFAPPVTLEWANQMTKSVPKGCKAASKPAYGKPSVALTCTDAKKQPKMVIRGLFGDAWLSCELTGKAGEAPATLQKRASRWCLVTATAAAA